MYDKNFFYVSNQADIRSISNSVIEKCVQQIFY